MSPSSSTARPRRCESVKAVASGPKHSTGFVGGCVSGVSDCENVTYAVSIPRSSAEPLAPDFPQGEAAGVLRFGGPDLTVSAFPRTLGDDSRSARTGVVEPRAVNPQGNRPIDPQPRPVIVRGG